LVPWHLFGTDGTLGEKPAIFLQNEFFAVQLAFGTVERAPRGGGGGFLPFGGRGTFLPS
jgi:hypothetical protein